MRIFGKIRTRFPGKVKKDKIKGDYDRPVTEHLAELRGRIIVTAVAVLASTILMYYLVPGIIRILLMPVAKFKLTLAYFSLVEAFAVRIKLGFIISLILLSPLIFLQLMAFAGPGLKKSEKKLIYSIILYLTPAFLSGIIFGYIVIIPKTLDFLISFGKSYMTPVLSGDRYISFISVFCLVVGIVFSIPPVLVFLGRMGILSSRALKKGRKFVIIGLFAIEVTIMPMGDIFMFILPVLPLVVFYEASIWIIYFIERKRNKLQKADKKGLIKLAG